MDNLENLSSGLANFTQQVGNISKYKINDLLNLACNIKVLEYRALTSGITDIGYMAQDLILEVQEELNKRCR